MRQTWIEALNLTTIVNFKTTYICSDHFEEKCFYDKDEFRTRNRLLTSAVPEIIIEHASTSSTNEINNRAIQKQDCDNSTMKECDENETPSTPVSSGDFTSPNPTAENVSLSTNEAVTSQSSTETFAEDVTSQNGSSNLDIQAQSLNTNTRNVSNSRKR